MDPSYKLKVKLELYWILATVVLIVGVMYPIYRNIDNYPFFWINVVFIAVFMSFIRYILFLKYTLIAHKLWAKLIILAISFPIIIFLVASFNSFRNYIDEQGIQSFFEKLSAQDNEHISSYIKNETIFFSVGSILVSVALPFRMLISVWRQINKKGNI
ncbi:MAG TPA: hypothetical protein VK590_02675 [Saprospiraceae bacterium]|nr:hypothetical protein [Saprospiraceae bacterium]